MGDARDAVSACSCLAQAGTYLRLTTKVAWNPVRIRSCRAAVSRYESPTQPIVRKGGEGGDKAKLGARILALSSLVSRAPVHSGLRIHGPPRKGIDGRRQRVSAPRPLFVKTSNTEEIKMKTSQSRRGFLLAVVAGACLLPSVSHAANIIVGSGSDTSYFVLQSTNLGERTYEVHYTYSPGTSQDGFFLLDQIMAADTTITLVLNDFGSSQAHNYFVDSITYNGVIEANDFSPPDFAPYWSHWVSGGEAGFPTPSPVASGTWGLGSGISSPYRLIAPGSWDALYYSDGLSVPSVAPVPETSSAFLAVLGSVAIFKRRRKN